MHNVQFPVATSTYQNRGTALSDIIVKDRWGALKGIWTVQRVWSEVWFPPTTGPLNISLVLELHTKKNPARLFKGHSSPKTTQWPATIKANAQKDAELHLHWGGLAIRFRADLTQLGVCNEEEPTRGLKIKGHLPIFCHQSGSVQYTAGN